MRELGARTPELGPLWLVHLSSTLGNGGEDDGGAGPVVDLESELTNDAQ